MLLKIVEEWLAMRGVWRPIYTIDGIINKKWIYNKYKCTLFNIETKVITIRTIYCTAKMLGFKSGWWYSKNMDFVRKKSGNFVIRSLWQPLINVRLNDKLWYIWHFGEISTSFIDKNEEFVFYLISFTKLCHIFTHSARVSPGVGVTPMFVVSR